MKLKPRIFPGILPFRAYSVIQSCPTLCDPMGCNLLGSSVQGILQARLLEWVAISYTRGSSQLRDRTCISCVSCFGRWILYHLCHQFWFLRTQCFRGISSLESGNVLYLNFSAVGPVLSLYVNLLLFLNHTFQTQKLVIQKLRKYTFINLISDIFLASYTYNIYLFNMGFPGASVAENLPAKQETLIWSLCREDALEKEMATQSSILAWEIPWTEELGRL